jgi:aminopeptidase N
MTRSRILFGLAALSTAMCLSIGAAAVDARVHFKPGAPGVGDSYFPLEGNGGYDVKHYTLNLAYDPGTDRLDGLAVVSARATQNLSRFDLDFQQLDVSAVRVDGRRARFVRRGQELVIKPRSGIREGSRFDVAVRYGGVPQTIVGSPIVFGSPYGFVHTDDGAFMGDEPNASSTWFPSNDHPSDKAAYTFRVTVPEGLAVASNGRLVSRRTRGGKSTFVWDEKYPMATYLATADIGRWVFRNGTTPGGIPETVAVDPTLLEGNPSPNPIDFFFDNSAEATDLWTDTFGRYPFDSTGAIVDKATYNGQTIGFSLETQTRPLYSDVRSDSTIAHELAHQWFGDSVSVRRWKHIWLNEGFASFAQYLWDEHRGVRTAHADFLLDYARPASDPFWNQAIADPQRDTMFARAVYRRGAMTLQALREKIGDRKFFRILRRWAAEHRYRTATTHQFIALSERVSGRDLGHFFRVWLYTPSKPTSW